MSVIDRFDQGSFFEQNFVGNTHQWILHIVFNFSDKLYTIKEKVLKQSLTGISFVCTWFSFDVLRKLTLLQWFPVIHVFRREHKIENLTLVIDYQMQLESEEPSHWIFSTLGKFLKCFMNKDFLVTTNTWRSRVDKTDAGTGSRQYFFDEYGYKKPDAEKGVSDVYRHILCSNAWNSGNHRITIISVSLISNSRYFRNIPKYLWWRIKDSISILIKS